VVRIPANLQPYERLNFLLQEAAKYCRISSPEKVRQVLENLKQRLCLLESEKRVEAPAGFLDNLIRKLPSFRKEVSLDPWCFMQEGRFWRYQRLAEEAAGRLPEFHPVHEVVAQMARLSLDMHIGCTFAKQPAQITIAFKDAYKEILRQIVSPEAFLEAVRQVHAERPLPIWG
jgi:hypothetical protein